MTQRLALIGDGIVDSATAAHWLGVKPVTIRQWRHRDLLKPVAGTPRRPQYDMADLLVAAVVANPDRASQVRAILGNHKPWPELQEAFDKIAS